MFSVRIVDADFYVTKPLPGLDVVHSEFRESAVTRVPVIRIFGSTPSGQKTCLHVHQVFPYIFVPYDGTQPSSKYLTQFATSVDFAVQVALGKASSSTHHVYDASIVRRIPFYGYHEEEQDFIKIQFYNPRIVARVVDLLQNGAILNKVFQPHESHIPYILQFLMDFNLYGMNLLHAQKVKFRGWSSSEATALNSVPSSWSGNSSPSDSFNSGSFHVAKTSYQHWNERTIPSDLRLDRDVPKISRCELEVDVICSDILNRLEIGTSIGSNPGIVAMWEDERQRRRDHEQASQITLPLSQDRDDMSVLDTEKEFKARIREIISERNQITQNQLEKLDKSHLDSLSPEDFHELSQSILLNMKESESPVVMSQDIDETIPVVDETIIEDVLQASRSQSQSQRLSGQLDKDLVDILVSLADDPNLPVSQECSPKSSNDQAVVEDRETVDESENEDEVSLVMSQPVWSTDAASSADSSGSKTGENDEDADGNLQRTPQLDGIFDDESEVENTWTNTIAIRGENSVSSCTRDLGSSPDKNDSRGRVFLECLSERTPQLDGCHDDDDVDQTHGGKTMSVRGESVPERVPQLDGCHDNDDVDQSHGGKRISVRGESVSECVPQLDGCHDNDDVSQNRGGKTSARRNLASRSRPDNITDEKDDGFNDFKSDLKRPKADRAKRGKNALKSKTSLTTRQRKRVIVPLQVSEGNTRQRQTANNERSTSGCEGSTTKPESTAKSSKQKYSDKMSNERLDGEMLDTESKTRPRSPLSLKNTGKRPTADKKDEVLSGSSCLESFETNVNAELSSESQTSEFKLCLSDSSSDDGDFKTTKKKRSGSSNFEAKMVGKTYFGKAKNIKKAKTNEKAENTGIFKFHSFSSEGDLCSMVDGESQMEQKDSRRGVRSLKGEIRQPSIEEEKEGCHILSGSSRKQSENTQNYSSSSENQRGSRHTSQISRNQKNASQINVSSRTHCSNSKKPSDASQKQSNSGKSSKKFRKSTGNSKNDFEPKERKRNKKVNSLKFIESTVDLIKEGVLEDKASHCYRNPGVSQKCFRGKKRPSDGELVRNKTKKTDPEGLEAVFKIPVSETMVRKQVKRTRGWTLLDAQVKLKKHSAEGLFTKHHDKLIVKGCKLSPGSASRVELQDSGASSSSQALVADEETDLFSNALYQMSMLSPKSAQSDKESPPLPSSSSLDPSFDELVTNFMDSSEKCDGTDVKVDIADDSAKLSEDDVVCIKDSYEYLRKGLGNGVDVPDLGDDSCRDETLESVGSVETAVNVLDVPGHAGIMIGESEGYGGTIANLGGVPCAEETLGCSENMDFLTSSKNVPCQDELDGSGEHEGTIVSLEDVRGHEENLEKVEDDETVMNSAWIEESVGQDGTVMNLEDIPCHGESSDGVADETIVSQTRDKTMDLGKVSCDTGFEENVGYKGIMVDVQDFRSHVETLEILGDKRTAVELEKSSCLAEIEGRVGQEWTIEDLPRHVEIDMSEVKEIPEQPQVSAEPRQFSLEMPRTTEIWKPVKDPPSPSYVLRTRDLYGLPHARHQKAFCSNPKDVPSVSRTVGGRRLHVSTLSVGELSEFDQGGNFLTLCQIRNLMGDRMDSSFVRGCLRTLSDPGGNLDNEGYTGAPAEIKLALMGEHDVVITPAKLPPSSSDVRLWMEKRRSAQNSATALIANELEEISSPKHHDVCDDVEPLVISSSQSLESGNVQWKGNDENNRGEAPSVFPSSQLDGCSTTSRQITPMAKPKTLSQSSGFGIQLGLQHSTPVGSQTKHLELFESSPLELEKIPFEKAKTSTPQNQVEAEAFDVREKCPRISGLRRNILASQVKENAEDGHRRPSFDGSCIEGPTPDNTCGFKISQPNLQDAKTLHEVQYLTLLSVELHIRTRKTLRPDPEFDPICAIFYNIEHDTREGKGNVTGVIVVNHESTKLARTSDPGASTSTQVNDPGTSTRTVRTDPGATTSIRAYNPVGTTSGRNNPGASGSSRGNDLGASVHSRGNDPKAFVHSTENCSRTFVTSGESDPGTSVGNRGRDSGASTSSKRSFLESYRTCGASARDNGAQEDTGDPMGTTGDKKLRVSRARDCILWKAGFADDFEIISVDEEHDAIARFIELVHKWDPDVLVGYEVQMLSWGYLLQRSTTLGVDLASQLSRVQDSSGPTRFDAERDLWGANHMSEISIAGRIVLNVWRLVKHEVALNIYTFENIAYHVLHERIPLFTFQQLARWWDQRLPHNRWRTAEHYITRCQGNIKILNHLDLVNRTSEFARLYGILFYSVISRGSQFRVESMMLRLAKPMNYVAVSPSIQQRARMCAPECIPLVMEPESRFYTDPVVVLDFQSLYPSMMIAYNYCFSTCLGKVARLDTLGNFEFGCTSLNVPPSLLEKLESDIHVSANGAAFVKSNVRRGILPRMVEEILNTRVMVKQAMKKYKKDKALQRLLDARQLGLKLIANVTYGYTSANFSGRMPCVEIADAIVRKARETLERAIHLVNTREEWGARVVYGDTDSLFVLLRGATKEEAFKIGKEIVDAVTAANPKPVKLKFEKVYLPCVLQTKKRYVGYMYETLDQKEPVFDTKGTETVRRDSCPAVAKILEKSLRILFEEKDISLVKTFVQRQFRKLMEDRVSLQDFIFAKEYRGMRNYKPSACVPALELARRRLSRDRRAEPRVGERVPYLVVYGSPGLPLIQLVRSSEDVLQDPSLRLNAAYYITKQILPPLDRAFALIGIDVFSWYAELPRFAPRQQTVTKKPKTSISRYFTTLHCPVCETLSHQGLCQSCRNNPQKAVITLAVRIRNWERKYDHLNQICYQCCGTRDPEMVCVSLDCPVLYKLTKAQRKLSYAETLRDVQRNIENANR